MRVPAARLESGQSLLGRRAATLASGASRLLGGLARTPGCHKDSVVAILPQRRHAAGIPGWLCTDTPIGATELDSAQQYDQEQVHSEYHPNPASTARVTARPLCHARHDTLALPSWQRSASGPMHRRAGHLLRPSRHPDRLRGAASGPGYGNRLDHGAKVGEKVVAERRHGDRHHEDDQSQ